MTDRDPYSLNKTPKYNHVLFLLGIIFISFNLRPAITSVGPLVSPIRTATGISTTSFGLLTTLPVVAFGVFSIVAPKLGRRYGNETVLFVALLILTLGIVLRSTGSLAFLYFGTTLIGLGIAICNVLIIGVIKDRLPNKIGMMTGIYTTAMSLMASVASGLSVPLAENLQLGWGKTLAIWSLLSAITIILWAPQLRNQVKPQEEKERKRIPIWRSALSWQVTLFMGFQASIFYCFIAWIPEILVSEGHDPVTAGLMLTFMQIMGIPGNFLIPILATRLKNQIGIVIGIAAGYLLGFIGVYIGGNVIFIAICMILIGFSQGAGISLILTLFGLRTRTGEEATDLSGMAQSGGYMISAIGPIVMGLSFDLFHTWTPALLLFLIFVVGFAGTGLLAARDKFVFDQESVPYKKTSSI